MTNTDMLIISKTTGVVQVKDYWILQTILQPTLDSQQDVFFESGDFNGQTNTWDITISRNSNTSETSQDQIITPNSMGISFVKGSQNVPQFNSINTYTVQFKQIVECDSTCLTCSGSLSTQCLSCPANFFLNSSNSCQSCQSGCSSCTGTSITSCTSCIPPLQLVSTTCIQCSTACATCYGVSSSQCKTCASLSQIPYYGQCIDNYPQFWNPINNLTGFGLYYGFDSTQNYIYFLFQGQNQGWVGLGFGTSHLQADLIMLSKQSNGNAMVKDCFSNSFGPPTNDTDVTQSVIIISGGVDQFGVWNIIVVRKLNTGDNLDSVLAINLNKTNLMFAYGKTYDMSQAHTQDNNNRFQIGLVNFTNVKQIVCDSSCNTCIGVGINQCTTCNPPFIYASGRCIICHASCKTCNGTLATHCTSCTFPLILYSNGTCKLSSQNCIQPCLTCSGNTISQCFDCNTTVSVLFQGYCIKYLTTFWNKLAFNSSYDLYYGQDDSNPDWIYFKFKGTNLGWVGIGFEHTMFGTDVLTLSYVNGQVYVKHGYSIGNFAPQTDLIQNLIVLNGSRDSFGFWNVYFAKKKLTLNPNDVQITTGLDYRMALVFANSDNVQVKHSSVVIIPTFQFASKQQCDASCQAGCSGPEPGDCTTNIVNQRGGIVGLNTILQSQILKIFSSLILFLAISILFI